MLYLRLSHNSQWFYLFVFFIAKFCTFYTLIHTKTTVENKQFCQIRITQHVFKWNIWLWKQCGHEQVGKIQFLWIFFLGTSNILRGMCLIWRFLSYHDPISVVSKQNRKQIQPLLVIYVTWPLHLPVPLIWLLSLLKWVNIVFVTVLKKMLWNYMTVSGYFHVRVLLVSQNTNQFNTLCDSFMNCSETVLTSQFLLRGHHEKARGKKNRCEYALCILA